MLPVLIICIHRPVNPPLRIFKAPAIRHTLIVLLFTARSAEYIHGIDSCEGDVVPELVLEVMDKKELVSMRSNRRIGWIEMLSIRAGEYQR